MTPRTRTISERLSAELQPRVLSVVDDSALHAGHAGAAPGGQTHFSVTVVSSRFEGMSRVDRSRLVHSILRAEFETGLHALALTLRTPAEEAARTNVTGV